MDKSVSDFISYVPRDYLYKKEKQLLYPYAHLLLRKWMDGFMFMHQIIVYDDIICLSPWSSVMFYSLAY